MELFLELFLTISLSFIFTSLFIKLVSMQSISTDKNEFLEEPLKVDKFQQVPFKEEVIKVQECPSEGKSLVEYHKVVGVEMEDKFQDVIVDDTNKIVTKNDDHNGEENSNISEFSKSHDFEIRSNSGLSEIDISSYFNNDWRSGENKMCEIEIESVEEYEEGVIIEKEIMEDWEEIGKNDIEELIIGNKTGLKYVDFGYEK